jgi:ribonucleoside-triphosphate reductase
MSTIQIPENFTIFFACKRDGKSVQFDATKIFAALLKASGATSEFGETTAKKLTTDILKLLQITFPQAQTIDIEDIQNVVETILMKSPYKKTAKAYILYREQHKNLRDLIQRSQISLIDNYLKQADWQIKENSNMDFSLQGLNYYISSNISKTYWLSHIYPEKIRHAHLSGDFHIHDLGLLSVYCVGWDLQDLLRIGFTGVEGKISSAPPKHFSTALGQIVNFFYTMQGEAAGAQAFSNFDTLLAPFIHYDRLSYKEIKQTLQEFIFNLNVPTRVGFQSPFTNLTFDLIPPKILKEQPIIIGGKIKNHNYGEFQAEINLFNKAFLEVLEEGDASGRIFTFPIPTFNISKNFPWENPHLKKLWRITAKYGIPYFANFINSDLSPDDVRSMCCRLRIDNRKLATRGGGLFGANPLTGSIGVVTINLPRIAYLAKSKSDFLNRLKHVMDLAKQSLEIKRKALEKLTESGLYPYTKFYLRHIKQYHDQYWINHFSTIGLIGMNEAMIHLFGKNIGNAECHQFAGGILDFMRDQLLTYQKETGNNYNLEATPAESTSYRLADLDRKKFFKTNCTNTSDAEKTIYTNSSQLPVNYTDDVFSMLEHQDSLQTKYTGGTVLHIFVGEEIIDPTAVKRFIKKVCNNYRLPYFSITPTFSICCEHGYLSGKQPQCPHCGKKTEIYSRVVGYYRPVRQWNIGKRYEFSKRKEYLFNEDN